MTFLWSLIQGSALKIGLYLAIAGAVAAVLLGARRAGRNAERVDNLTRAMENARERREIDIDVRGASDGALDDGLRPPSRRR